MIRPDMVFPEGISWMFWRERYRNEAIAAALVLILCPVSRLPTPKLLLLNSSLPGFCRTPTLKSPTFLLSFSETLTSSHLTSLQAWFFCANGSGRSAMPCWMRWVEGMCRCARRQWVSHLASDLPAALVTCCVRTA